MTEEKKRKGTQLLSPEERKIISAKAIKARWDNPVLKVTHGQEDHPLIIGDIQIPCFVLEDGRRVLVQRGISAAIGLHRSASNSLSVFCQNKGIESFIGENIVTALNKPIKFKTPLGAIANGYEATILVDICESVLRARDSEKLVKAQENIAMQCEILIRGLARVGIIALVDEATGYQDERKKDGLSLILEAFIAKELQPWVKTFPLDFYKQLFRLRGLEFNKDNIRRPQYFGMITNNIIYKRLAPGVLDELKKMTPRTKSGNKSVKYFQNLTLDTGYRKLLDHLSSVVTIMKLSATYEEFINTMDFIHPLLLEDDKSSSEQEQGI